MIFTKPLKAGLINQISRDEGNSAKFFVKDFFKLEGNRNESPSARPPCETANKENIELSQWAFTPETNPHPLIGNSLTKVLDRAFDTRRRSRSRLHGSPCGDVADHGNLTRSSSDARNLWCSKRTGRGKIRCVFINKPPALRTTLKCLSIGFRTTCPRAWCQVIQYFAHVTVTIGCEQV